MDLSSISLLFFFGSEHVSMITDLRCRGTTGEILRRWVTGEIGAASLDLHFRHWVYGRDWENNKGKNEEERQRKMKGREAEKDES